LFPKTRTPNASLVSRLSDGAWVQQMAAAGIAFTGIDAATDAIWDAAGRPNRVLTTGGSAADCWADGRRGGSPGLIAGGGEGGGK
jgi:hypothetical protein